MDDLQNKWWLTITDCARIERFLEAAAMHGMLDDEVRAQLTRFMESCRLTPAADR